MNFTLVARPLWPVCWYTHHQHRHHHYYHELIEDYLNSALTFVLQWPIAITIMTTALMKCFRFSFTTTTNVNECHKHYPNADQYNSENYCIINDQSIASSSPNKIVTSGGCSRVVIPFAHLIFATVVFFFTNASIIHVSNGLKILHYSIPKMVDATNVSAVTLDCVYSYDPGDVKLVVRWFHNDSPEPIYQWIPEPDIRYVGELIRPYFDMDFVVNQDRYSKFRALRLDLRGRSKSPGARLKAIGAAVALTGNYSCVISSIANQDTRQSQMVVYVPPKVFDFHFVELGPDQIALECLARGVFPRPVLTFSEQYSSNFSQLYRYPSVNVSVSVNDASDTSSGDETSSGSTTGESAGYLYSASFLHPIHTTLTPGTIYECRIQLPGTMYVRKKRIKIIFPTSYMMKPGTNVGDGVFRRSFGVTSRSIRSPESSYWPNLLLIISSTSSLIFLL